MDKRIKETFDSIHASDELRQSTYQWVQKKRDGSCQKTPQRRRWLRPLGLIGAALVAFVVLFGSARVYQTQTAYISLDINPSLSVAINDYDRVIHAQAYNKEGQQILDEVKIDGKPYVQAMQELIESSGMRPYLVETDTLWLAVQANDPEKEERMQADLEQTVENVSRRHHTQAKAVCSGVPYKMREEAENYGISAGKYKAILELHELEPEATVEEYSHHSMGEIQSRLHGHQRRNNSRSGGGRTSEHRHTPKSTPESAGGASERKHHSGHMNDSDPLDGSRQERGSGHASPMPSERAKENEQASGSRSSGRPKEIHHGRRSSHSSTAPPAAAGSGQPKETRETKQRNHPDQTNEKQSQGHGRKSHGGEQSNRGHERDRHE